MGGAPLPRAYLLDIEGTTTPIDFVAKTLFPYARREARHFIENSLNDPIARLELIADCCQLSEEYAAEASPPEWPHRPDPLGAVDYLHWLMDQDRKSTGLKSIEGKIWQHGYRSGALRGEVYPDVWPAVERWKARGAKVCIFSSGSVLAQKLLFGSLPEGDLTTLLDGYFDTTTGPKREAASYAAIAAAMDLPPADVHFLSDIAEEVSAARGAGMAATLVVRDPGPTVAPGGSASDFDGLP